MLRTTWLLMVVLAAMAARAAAAPPAPFVTEQPLRDCKGVLCIDVVLDGAAPRTLLLDTGNPRSMLVTEVARTLGWTLSPYERQGKAVDGVHDGGTHRAALAGVEAREPFIVIDRTLLGDDPLPVDGSIAYDFFKDRILQIDYGNHRLRISAVLEGAPGPHAGEAARLELVHFGQHGPPIVVGAGFSVNGKALRAQIDTAYTGTLLVYDSAVDGLGLVKQGAPKFFPYTDGGVEMLASRADRIGFGSRVVAAQPTLYFVGGGKNPAHQPDGLFEATVGNALFARSVLTLDFHAMTLDVQPSSG